MSRPTSISNVDDLSRQSFSPDVFAVDFTENHEWFKLLLPGPQLLGPSELGGLPELSLDCDSLTTSTPSIGQGLLLTPIISNDLWVINKFLFPCDDAF